MEDKIIELLRKNRIGKEKAVYLAHELLFLLSVVGRSEQLKAIVDLKEHCSQRYEHWERDEIERLVDSL